MSVTDFEVMLRDVLLQSLKADEKEEVEPFVPYAAESFFVDDEPLLMFSRLVWKLHTFSSTDFRKKKGKVIKGDVSLLASMFGSGDVVDGEGAANLAFALEASLQVMSKSKKGDARDRLDDQLVKMKEAILDGPIALEELSRHYQEAPELFKPHLAMSRALDKYSKGCVMLVKQVVVSGRGDVFMGCEGYEPETSKSVDELAASIRHTLPGKKVNPFAQAAQSIVAEYENNKKSREKTQRRKDQLLYSNQPVASGTPKFDRSMSIAVAGSAARNPKFERSMSMAGGGGSGKREELEEEALTSKVKVSKVLSEEDAYRAARARVSQTAGQADKSHKAVAVTTGGIETTIDRRTSDVDQRVARRATKSVSIDYSR